MICVSIMRSYSVEEVESRLPPRVFHPIDALEHISVFI